MDSIVNDVDKTKQNNIPIYLLENDFLNFIYKCLNVLNYHRDVLDGMMKHVERLNRFNESEEDKVDYFQSRQAVFAYFNNRQGIKTSFDIKILTNDDIESIKHVIAFCVKYTFFPWDIMRPCPTGEELAISLLEKGNIAKLIPRFERSASYKQLVEISKAMEEGILVSSLEFIAEMTEYHTEYKKKLSVDIKNKKDQSKNVKVLMQEQRVNNIALKLYEGKEVQEKNINTCARGIKAAIKPSYTGQRSLWPRIIGLMLWDEFYGTSAAREKNSVEKDTVVDKHAISVKKMYERVISKKIVQKLLEENNEASQAFLTSDRNLQRWFLATKKSIEVGEYVDIEG